MNLLQNCVKNRFNVTSVKWLWRYADTDRQTNILANFARVSRFRLVRIYFIFSLGKSIFQGPQKHVSERMIVVKSH